MRAVGLLGPNADERDVLPFAAVARTAIPIASTVDSGADVALVFGGDGTVHRHLPALVSSGVPMLVVPMGSGNDFARAIGLGTKEQSLSAWRKYCASQDNDRAIDVGEITSTGDNSRETGHLFCCVAGAGIDADVNRRANQQPRWLRAHGGYFASVFEAAMTFQPQRISVEFEDVSGATGTISEPALMCAFANAGGYGHGMRIAPGAQLDDGLLDMVFIRRAGLARLLSLFWTVYFGGHMGLREVEHRQIRRMSISSETPLDIYADGEFICRTPAEVGVRPRALRGIGDW
jgi:diacylglycerol kinase (ATP)